MFRPDCDRADVVEAELLAYGGQNSLDLDSTGEALVLMKFS